MSIRVTIIILNWNNAPDTLACLNSLIALDCPACDVLVVDNGSIDDSVALVRAGFPTLPILETSANLGYAGGNNVGIRQALAAGAEAICILNNDIMVEEDFLTPLLTTLYEHPEIGIVTPLVGQRNHGNSVWALGSTINWRTAEVTRQFVGEPIDGWRQKEPFEVDVASGAAMLVRAEVFQKVGFMDEDFFLYFEETDWCTYARQAGYRILAVPKSLVWHAVSGTLGTTSPIIDYYMLRNHLRFINRHWRGPQRLSLQARVIIRNIMTIAAFTVRNQGGQRTPKRNARMRALWDAARGRWGKAELPSSYLQRASLPAKSWPS